MKVRIIGCGEAFDWGYGNNACLAYGENLPTVLFDCGYQIPERLWRTPNLCDRIDVIWISHLHADHYFGVVPLIAKYWEETRTLPLRIAGPAGTGEVLEKLLDLGYPELRPKLGFPLLVSELREGDLFQVDDLVFQCAHSRHLITNLAVRIRTPDGTSVGVSGDGALTDGTRQLFRDVDLLLHETYASHPDVEHHMDLKNLQHYASGEGHAIGRIGVTHISRFQREDMEHAVRELSEADPRWFLPVPGLEIDVKSREAPLRRYGT